MSQPESRTGSLPTVDQLAPVTSGGQHPRPGHELSIRQANVLRVGYLFMGVGLAVIKWPLLVSHAPWDLAEGTNECLLIAKSFGCGSRGGTSCGGWERGEGVAGLVHAVLFLVEVEGPVLLEVAVAA
jgi:hypothetical protein